jgi:pentatricopeptide repeat protein
MTDLSYQSGQKITILLILAVTQMIQDGISFDHYVFNTLICGYAKRQMVDEALQVFYREQGLSPNAVSYGTIR